MWEIFNEGTSGRDLGDADLTGADLHWATLFGANYSANTEWPEEFNPRVRGAKLVEDIFEMYVGNGVIGASAIAKHLNAKRIPSPHRAPYKRPELRSIWYNATVHRILRNETYRGMWQFGKKKVEPISVQVPPIIYTELWSAAKRRLMFAADHGQPQ